MLKWIWELGFCCLSRVFGCVWKCLHWKFNHSYRVCLLIGNEKNMKLWLYLETTSLSNLVILLFKTCHSNNLIHCLVFIDIPFPQNYLFGVLRVSFCGLFFPNPSFVIFFFFFLYKIFFVIIEKALLVAFVGSFYSILLSDTLYTRNSGDN